MSREDRHGLAKVERIIAMIVSALFVVLGLLGFQNSGDISQLLLFLLIAGISWWIVGFLFRLVERLLDSLG
jgi:uncharacterized membrane protein YhdT